MLSRKDITREFRICGLAVTHESLQILLKENVLSGDLDAQRETIQALAEAAQKAISASGAPAVLSESVLREAMAALRPPDSEELRKSLFSCISAGEMPVPAHITSSRRLSRKTGCPVFGGAGDRNELYARRYEAVRERVLRHGLFSEMAEFGSALNLFGANENPQIETIVRNAAVALQGKARLVLTTIDSLSGKSGEFCVLGMLSQTAERWILEDPTGSIPADFANAIAADGLLTECAVLLVLGHVRDGVFCCDVVGHPPAEPRDASLAALPPGFDYFGKRPADNVYDILAEEARRRDPTVVFLSDVWLDSPAVMNKLERIFSGFNRADAYPDMFVLCGNFVSKPFGGGADQTTVIGLFTALANLIKSHDVIAKLSSFVFVPGPADPVGSVGCSFPAPPLPKVFVRPLIDLLGDRVHFPTNPCRMRCGDLEWTLFRNDTVRAMQRHCVIPSKAQTGEELSQNYIRAVCEQAHLAPLPLSVAPVFWNLDHCLSLSPLPHMVLLADSVASFQHVFHGTAVLNPGPFARDHCMLVYNPFQNTANVCAIDQ